MLQCVALCCIVLQCNSFLIKDEERPSVVRISFEEEPVVCRVARGVGCNGLQCVAAWCSVLQCNAVSVKDMECSWCYSPSKRNLLPAWQHDGCVTGCGSVLQCVCICLSCHTVSH